MSDQLLNAITAAKEGKISFSKHISANDAGETSGHQGGIYVPKCGAQLMFEHLGKKGSNMDKITSINWFDGRTSKGCRFVYYGQGTRDEYRITRLSRKFKVGDFIIIVKESDDLYSGYTLSNDDEVRKYFQLKDLKE